MSDLILDFCWRVLLSSKNANRVDETRLVLQLHLQVLMHLMTLLLFQQSPETARAGTICIDISKVLKEVVELTQRN